MASYEIHSVGVIRNDEEGARIELEKDYIPALKALDGFSHINTVWWFSDFDTPEARAVLDAEQPYRNSPDRIGIFATRSPLRPNPIALTVSEILDIDFQNGVIHIAYSDANDNTPVLDIKPYTPSMDRVETPCVPSWCGHWPKSLEASADFDWESVFNF